MDASLHSKLHDLGDLELAVLVCLNSEQHCVVSSVPSIASELPEELRRICADTFGLHTSLIKCSSEMSVDDFSEAVLVNDAGQYEDAVEKGSGTDYPTFSVDLSPRRGHSPGRFGSVGNRLDDRRIADVVIADQLDLTDSSVQVQTLELLRMKRIFTRTSMHMAPRNFLFVATLSRLGARLTHHLHDMFAISHFHAEEDGLQHLDGNMDNSARPLFSADDLKALHDHAQRTRLTAEVSTYLHNIVIFMRNSRYVKGGVTAAATRHFHSISKSLAILHNLDFVPPSLVALAARKIYPHRLVLATAENERSLQWGSDPEAVRQMLAGVTIEDVIEDVLASVETPL